MKPLFPIHRVLIGVPLLAAGLLVCAGCNRSDDTKITVYRIPKETQPESTMQPVAMNGAAPAGVHWTAPTDWEEQPASGFRKGSFLVRGPDGKTADVSVISFPEGAGGVLANVNRWRNQLKLAPIAEEAKAGTPLPVDGHDMLFVDLLSEEPILPDGSKSRILGGILPLNGETWFFKMMGPDALVESQRDAFKQFLQSVHAASGTVASMPAPMTTNAGGSTNAPPPPPIEAPPSVPVQYALPANWKEKPLSPMRLASFDATAPNGKQADISIVSLPGIAGGDLANVNRWRGQLNLEPIDEKALQQSAEHIKANGHDFLMVDLASAGPLGDKNEKQRIIAAILDEKDRSWFIKMTGEDEAVASQKSAFTDFLRSLKIP